MYIAAACHSFVQSRRSTLLLCRVGVTAYDYECTIYHIHWMAQSYSTYQRSKHNKEEGGRADSWWNPQRTKGFATLLIISDHSVWFIMVWMLQSFTSKSSYFIRSFQHDAFKSSFQVIKTLSDHPHEDLFQIFVSHFEILFLMRTVHPSSSKV